MKEPNSVSTTVLIMEQALIHASDAVIEKLPQWKQKKLEIFWLLNYSPKLNLIEILGKFIKYEWIEVEGQSGNPTMPNRLVEIDAYNSSKSFKKYLTKVFDELGSKYVINFVYLLRQ